MMVGLSSYHENTLMSIRFRTILKKQMEMVEYSLLFWNFRKVVLCVLTQHKILRFA